MGPGDEQPQQHHHCQRHRRLPCATHMTLNPIIARGHTCKVPGLHLSLAASDQLVLHQFITQGLVTDRNLLRGTVAITFLPVLPAYKKERRLRGSAVSTLLAAGKHIRKLPAAAHEEGPLPSPCRAGLQDSLLAGCVVEQHMVQQACCPGHGRWPQPCQKSRELSPKAPLSTSCACHDRYSCACCCSTTPYASILGLWCCAGAHM